MLHGSGYECPTYIEDSNDLNVDPKNGTSGVEFHVPSSFLSYDETLLLAVLYATIQYSYTRYLRLYLTHWTYHKWCFINAPVTSAPKFVMIILKSKTLHLHGNRIWGCCWENYFYYPQNRGICSNVLPDLEFLSATVYHIYWWYG